MEAARAGVTKPYRHEWLVLLLVGLTALSFYHASGAQDLSRLALTQAAYADGSLRIDPWVREAIDFAVYDGHYYSDKAPGMSFLALPGYAVLRSSGFVSAEDERAGVWERRGALGILRLLSGGLAFLAGVFLVGRVAEAIAANTGAASATAFGLGTLVFPFAATIFGHGAAAALSFTAFVVAWSARRRDDRAAVRLAVAGLCAGSAVVFEYQAAVIALVVLVYVAAFSPRGAMLFAAGGLVGIAPLAVYNSVAFDSPFRLSYRYVGEEFAERQSSGFFGVGVPDAGRLQDVLVSWKGLLVQSPVLVLAAAGLVLAWRAGMRAEAALCGAVAALFVAISAGYFDPFGGLSPGPRFAIPALPFLAVGFPLAFRRWPILTLAATTVSVGVMFYRAGKWSHLGVGEFDNVWGILGEKAIWSALGEGSYDRPVTVLGVVLTSAFALGALALSAKEVLSTRAARPQLHPAREL